MNKWILPSTLLIIAVGLVFSVVVSLKKDIFADIKNKADCNSKLCKDDPKCCVIWDSDICRKGKINDNNQCVSKGDTVPLLLGILAIIVFITFIVYLVKAIRK
jgi:hypothetical protein